MDSKLLRREIQESMDMTEEELEQATHNLMHAGNGSPAGGNDMGAAQPPTSPRPRYYEHLGGFAMHEMRDFNKFSSQKGDDDLEGSKDAREFTTTQEYSTDETDDMVYVTTL